jgi:hypothetical protein
MLDGSLPSPKMQYDPSGHSICRLSNRGLRESLGIPAASLAFQSVGYEASTLLQEPLAIVSVYQNSQNPYEKLSSWSFGASLTDRRRVLHDLAAYAQDGSPFLPAEAIAQLTQVDGVAAELLTCFDEDLEWDIERLFGLFRWMWRKRSFRIQQQNSKASMGLAEEHLQGNEQCRAALDQVIQRASKFCHHDQHIQPVLSQTALEELVFHLPNETTTSERPRMSTMLQQFRQSMPLQWSGERAEDLNVDRNEEFLRTLTSTIVQELRFVDGLVVRPLPFISQVRSSTSNS